MAKYNFSKIEKKWQKKWTEDKLYEVKDDLDKPKYYVLDMFPYPSGDGLHMGHTESYTASDIIYRFKRLQGYDVLHRQGFDSFGLPAENYAIKTGVHPKKTAEKNIKNYIKQMKMLGFGYDFSNLIRTSSPSYYKWTQWIFGKFFENGLVERKTDEINWCPSCQTVIANEQVADGKCERCKTKIKQKEVPSWFFKITGFAEDLIKDLDKVDWPEATKKNQRAWIGKSEGAIIKFQIVTKSELSKSNPKSKIQKNENFIKVFTTRPDTLFGATYLVLAPEHKFVASLLENNDLRIKNYEDVKRYIERAKNKTEMERLESKEKTGVKLEGLVAINPANGEKIPIFAADYVLGGYGTGAIMAVPAHDERDFEFAKKYNLPVKPVVHNYIEFWDEQTVKNGLSYGSKMIRRTFNSRKNKINDKKILDALNQQAIGDIKRGKCYINEGILINSGKFDGMGSEEAKKAITEFVGGKMMTNYRLRDWSISRQRYWGCPIPIVYSPKGEAKFVGEENLPWLLPEDVNFTPTGEAPLAKSKELKKRTEKIFGKGWTPEADTMDTFVDSSWYFLRYPDTENEKEFCSKEKLKRWLPVDLYIGGAEHTYMHLLYARFFVKAMRGMGLLEFDEPFMKLRHQGMVLDKNGVKMSKSKGNVVNPNDMVKKFGADATRMYMMFAGPLEEDVTWNEEGVRGVYRFLEKIYNLFQNFKFSTSNASKELLRLSHKTIKGVTEDVEGLKFNTAISKLMIFINECSRHKVLPREAMEKFLILLSPFAPFIAEELFNALKSSPSSPFKKGGEPVESIFNQEWPKYDPTMVKDEMIEIVAQVNGKVRDKIQAPADISEEEAKEKVLASEKIRKRIGGKKIKKIIFIKGRLVNVVV